MSDSPLRVGWFATARGQTSAKLFDAALEAIDQGLNARIEFVFSNRNPGDFETTDRFFERVRSAGVPLITLSDTKFRRKAGGEIARKGNPLPSWRRDYDEMAADLIGAHEFDIGVLAGYMLIFTEAVCERWPLVDLHPALPDGHIGVWQDGVWHLIETKAAESGVTTLVTTTDLDRGPTVAYCRYPLRGGEIDTLWDEQGARLLTELQAEGEDNPLFAAIRKRGVAREIPLLVETLRLLAKGDIRVARGKDSPWEILDAGGRPTKGLDLTSAVEAAVQTAELTSRA